MSTDHYKTLGVSRDASKAEIKKAWRAKVKELHPDINPDAEEEMKQVNLAYDVLKDPQKKQEFDNPESFSSGFNGFDPFSYNRRHAGFGDQQQMNNISTAVGVPLDIMIHGGSITVPVNIPQMSSGGPIFQMNIVSVRIPVTLKPNTPVGQRITIPKEQHGQSHIDTVVFEIYPENPKDVSYRIEMTNILMPIDVNVIDAIIGAQMEVDLPTGNRVKITLPKKLQANQTIRLANKGLHDVAGNTGDLFLIINLNIPEINDEQVAQIKNIFSS